jgi:acetoin utilization deacetylase AcuC-like enzyme
MPAGGGEAEYLAVFDEVFVPALREYQPGLLLMSAGFDAHSGDPLAQMELTGNGYGLMAGRLRDAAIELCENRSVWVLEGGYDLHGLSESVVAVLKQLITPA